MNLTLLSFLLLLNHSASKTPNFYPSFIAAKEASKNYQKDLLIFFTKRSNAECAAAWQAFENDQMATKVFISTMIDGYDFDGAVILDKYGLSDTPSWVILDYEGNLKQKWTGDWKNPHARPTTPPVETAKVDVPPVKEFKATTVAQQSAAAKTQTTSAPVTPVQTAPVVPAEKMTEPTPQPVAVTPVAAPVAGFVLQAGYFGSEANAQKLVNDLKAKGYLEYSIKTTSQNGSPYYRVVSPAFNSEVEANKEVQTLSTVGIKASVKKTSEI